MKREDIDEHLETLWHLLENDESDSESFKRHTKGTYDEGILKSLQYPTHHSLTNATRSRGAHLYPLVS